MNVQKYFAALMGYGDTFPQEMFRKWLQVNYPFTPATDKKIAEGFNPMAIAGLIPWLLGAAVLFCLVIAAGLIAVMYGHEGFIVDRIKSHNGACVSLIGCMIVPIAYWAVTYFSFSAKLKQFCKEKKKFAKLVLLPKETEENFQKAFEHTQTAIAREKLLLQNEARSKQSATKEAACHQEMKQLDEMARRLGLDLCEWDTYFTRAQAQLPKKVTGRNISPEMIYESVPGMAGVGFIDPT